jgi:hypothetical protein
MPLKRLTMTRTKLRAPSVGRHRRNSGAHTPCLAIGRGLRSRDYPSGPAGPVHHRDTHRTNGSEACQLDQLSGNRFLRALEVADIEPRIQELERELETARQVAATAGPQASEQPQPDEVYKRLANRTI